MIQSDKTDKLYKLDTYIKSDKFDVEDMSYYQLCISLSREHFRFCAINTLDHQCLLLQEYRFFTRLDTDELLSTLNRVYDNDMFLKANFWKGISIIQKEQPFTLVPQALFEASAPERYLQLVKPKTDKEYLVSNPQERLEAVSLSYVDVKVKQWFAQTYPMRDIQFVHQTTAFLEGIYQKFPHSEGTSSHIFVENNHFMMAIIREGELEFCNVFSYRDANDFIYYALFVFDELRLSRENSPLYIYGNVDPISAIYQKLQTYFGAVELLTENPEWINFEYLFEDIPNYHYFDLYSLYLLRDSL